MATYTSAASGLWSAGATWVGGVKPPSGAGHKIVIAAGHVVEYDEAAGTYGDDTSSATPANNAIYVLGTLSVSRTVSTSFTARGTVMIGQSGAWDWGSIASPVPSGVTAVLILNDSASMAAGKHGFTTGNTSISDWSAGSVRFVGAAKTINTSLTSSVAAGGSAIAVSSAVGWAVGNRIVLAAPGNVMSQAQVVTLASGGGLNWTVSPAITVARAIGCEVGNLSSNVEIRSMSVTSPSFVAVRTSTTATAPLIEIQDVRFADMGSNSSWATIAAANAAYQGALGFSTANSLPSSGVVVSRVAFEATNSASISPIKVSNVALNPVAFSDVAIHYPAGSVSAFQWIGGAGSAVTGVIYSAFRALESSNGDGCAGGSFSGYAIGSDAAIRFSPSIGLSVFNSKLRGAHVFNATNGTVTLTNCDIDCSTALLTVPVPGANYNITILGGTSSAASLSNSITGANAPSQLARVTFVRVNGVSSDNRVRSHWLDAVTDASIKRRGSYAAKIRPTVAGAAIRYTFSLPAVSGVAQVIKGSLRFDATYGTATPPSIALSGQGVTANFTAPATADSWHDFTLSFTPTGTGDITATVTVQSTSTAGFAWLDGIYHFPMIQSVRHFGYQWLPQAAQIVDPRITLTEAAALALPVSVNHGTSTITVTGAVTAREVFEACMADLVQTANQGQAVHIDSATGEAFETAYTVALSGAGAISGVYTDATGVHVTINVPGLIADTRVYLRNMTDGVDIANVKLTSTGYTLPVTWTADKTIRLRAGYAEGAVAKLPIEATGVLTNAGLTFIVTQEDDAVYNELGIDGATITEFTPDIPNVQIDISDPDGETSVQRLYVWTAWIQTSALGIVAMFRAMSASDTANYVIDQDIIDAKLDNVGTTPVRIIGGYLSRKDGSTLIVPTSNSIQIDPGKAYLATGGSLTSEIEAGLSGQDMLRIILAAVSGRTNGVGTDTENYLSVDGSKPRITSTFDGEGNRVTVDIDGAL